MNNYSVTITRKLEQRTRALMRTALQAGMLSCKARELKFIAHCDEQQEIIRQYKLNAITDCAKTMVVNEGIRDPSLVVSMMHKVLRNIAEHTDVDITAHSHDVVILKDALGDGQANCSVRKVSFQDDDSFDRGSLVIKANKSIIDAHVHTQLARAHGMLLQRLENKYGNAY